MTTNPFSQSVDILIQDDLNDTIQINNAHLDSGQFYSDPNRCTPITPQAIDDMAIPPHNHTDIYTSGKQGSLSGTQGAIDLHDQGRNERICTLSWSAPLGPNHRNDFEKLNQNVRYGVDVGGWNGEGELGQVAVTVRENYLME